VQLDEAERASLFELLHWWQNRRTFDADTDPLETMFGGVDEVSELQTTGTPIVYAPLAKPLVTGEGASFFVQAFGVPTNFETTGESYTLFGICHFQSYSGGYLTHYATTGKAPSGITPEVRSAVTGSAPNYVPVIGVTGIAATTINWKLEFYRLNAV
jgi:hypothetical protein